MKRKPRTKRYLNKAEKETCLVLAALQAYLETFVEKPSTIKTPTVLKNARTARTFIRKTLEAILEPLDPDEIVKVTKESKKMEVVACYTREALRQHERVKEMNTVTTLDTEDFLYIVEQAVCICQECEKAEKDADTCELRRVFIQQDIQVLDETAPPGKCPYQYK
jgi:hypothetical protein